MHSCSWVFKSFKSPVSLVVSVMLLSPFTSISIIWTGWLQSIHVKETHSKKTKPRSGRSGRTLGSMVTYYLCGPGPPHRPVQFLRAPRRWGQLRQRLEPPHRILAADRCPTPHRPASPHFALHSLAQHQNIALMGILDQIAHQSLPVGILVNVAHNADVNFDNIRLYIQQNCLAVISAAIVVDGHHGAPVAA